LIWQNFIAEDDDYAGVKPTDESGDVALAAVSNNQTTCMLVPAALNNSVVTTADGLNLVGVNDRDFDDAVDPQGKVLYTYKDLPSGTYAKHLQGWWSSKSTVSWLAKVYINKTLVTDTSQLKSLIRTVMKARGGIVSTFGS